MLKELRKQLDQREITVRALTEQYLTAIRGSSLNAYITVCEDLALSQADAAQKRLDAGNVAPLTGIPLSVKDNICTRGIRTTCGSRFLEHYTPPYDATIMERLYAQDIVLLGKTNLDEFAMGSSTRTSYFGASRNPYDPERVPGGSSGGSAAAVAARLCAASVGSDTGGSVRQPAAFCGVTGIKPTYGVISRHGVSAYASSFDQVGTIGESAEDCAILLDALCGEDPMDMTSARRSYAPFASKMGQSLKGLKFGLIQELMGDGVAPAVRDAVLSAADFYRQQGVTVETVSLPSLSYAIQTYYLISCAEASTNLSRLDGVKYGTRVQRAGDSYEDLIKRSRAECFGREVKRRILLGTYALCSGYYDAYYGKANALRARIREEMRELLERYDMLLSPTVPTTAYRLDESQDDPARLYVADICTVAANIAGLPAISTPCGYDPQGLPAGMMLTGRAFDEAGLLAAADTFEKHFDRKKPGVIA